LLPDIELDMGFEADYSAQQTTEVFFMIREGNQLLLFWKMIFKRGFTGFVSFVSPLQGREIRFL
jgi:hypothetical protein